MKNPFAALFGGNKMRETPPAQQNAPASGQDASAPRRGYDLGSLLSVGSSMQAMQIATVYRCAQIIGDTVAALPLQYLKRKGEVFLPVTDSELPYLLNCQPSDNLSAFDMWGTAIRQMLMDGNALIIPVRSVVDLGDDPLALMLCSQHSFTYDETNRNYVVDDAYNGIYGVYDESEVIHLKNISLDGKWGKSVLSYAQTTLSIAATGDNETMNRFANGGNIRGIVGNDTTVRGFGEYADKELAKTAKNLDERFRAGERIVNLPGQAKFSQISLSSVDMEFLESRKFGVREICRFFGVPPTFVFDDTSNNYKSAEMANISFLSQTIAPLLVKIEQELQRKLIPAFRYGKYKFEFDRRGLYASDLITKADYQAKTIGTGVWTINDWRAYENKPAVEGGDHPLVSANLKALDVLLSESATNNSSSNEESE